MKQIMDNKKITILLWVVLQLSGADGLTGGGWPGSNTALRTIDREHFHTSRGVRSTGTARLRRPLPTALHSTATNRTATAVDDRKNENINKTNSNSEDVIMQKQIIAKEALLRLLESQKRELRATEELIRNLDIDEPSSNNGATFKIGNAKKAKRAAPALMESIYAGVDYGFVSRSEGPRAENIDDLNNNLFTGYAPPSNIFSLGSQQFMRNLNAMMGEYKEEVGAHVTPKQLELRQKLKKLTLNSTAIWEREEARGEIVAPFIIKIPYYALCTLLDVVFEGRYVFSRLYLLETVARMPYFSYITMLHLYETLGFWRRSSEVKRVHFAEEWNEFHHLLVMESLGGDQAFWVRFVAQHSAIAYFVGLMILWGLSPSLSYKFSELLETHAVDTYGQFIDENEEALKKLPPSLAAVEYYTIGISDPMFGEYQTTATATGGEIRKSGKNMKSLYDVFTAIRADEGDHVGTMKACLDPSVPVLSPSLETRVLTGLALAASVGFYLSTGDLDIPTDVAGGVDDAIFGDQLIEGLLSGGAALLQGLQTLNEGAGELEAEVEVVEEAVAAGGAAMLLNNLRQALVEFFEVMRFL